LAAGVVLLGEPLTLRLVVATASVALGLLLVNRR
jgi:drug/metabolite transporter (DMT)-like permease